jgi:hypothetical protein
MDPGGSSVQISRFLGVGKWAMMPFVDPAAVVVGKGEWPLAEPA